MRRYWTFGALASLSFTILKPTASYAHHNQFQGFDPERSKSSQARSRGFAWQNPHAYIYVASGEGNEARSWRIETLSIAFMRRMGWGPDTLRAGDNVTVTINPSRTEGRATGWLIDLAVEGRDVPSLTDEKRVGAIFSGESTRTDARASSVIGTWITLIDSAEPWKWIDDPSQLELTEAGRRAVASLRPDSHEQQSLVRAAPRSANHDCRRHENRSSSMATSYGFEPSTIVTDRVAYLDARPPQAQDVARPLPRSMAGWRADRRDFQLHREHNRRHGRACLRAPTNIWSNDLRLPPTDNRCSTASS